MKLCWDTLEKMIYNKNGNFYSKTKHLYYIKICKNCGEEFLGQKNAEFCTSKCSNSGIFHSQYNKPKSNETKKKIGLIHKNKIVKKETIEKLQKITGDKTSNWKGGISKTKLTWYDTFVDRISSYEEVRRALDNENILEVKCKYCGKWFKPIKRQIEHRLASINGNKKGDNNLYCSNECKKACPIFHKVTITPNSKDDLNRENFPELRKLVLERDDYTCQKCGYKSDTRKDKGLHCHHIDPVKLDPIESADIDNCITLCSDCHHEVHKLPGCSTGFLANCIII